MAKIVSSWNDFDPLKRVIVGRADNSMIPPEEPATSEKVPVDSEMRGMWGMPCIAIRAPARFPAIAWCLPTAVSVRALPLVAPMLSASS